MVSINWFDYIIIISFFTITIGIGFWSYKQSKNSSTEFFLSGRSLPWWLLGISMVATTFSTDTPNLVTDIVRTDGVAGNWVWWAFLLTGLLTVFVYAKLWRRSNLKTDLEFYEIRYGGAAARFLRVFRAVYLGVIFNVITMSAVTLAAIKIGGIMLGLSPLATVFLGGFITVIFSALGGFKGVIYTDFVLFFAAMVGSIGAAYYLVNLPEVGGIEALFAHEHVQAKMSIIPSFNNTEAFITLLIIPLSVQWWSSWYPGAEPGGGGYIAQRMLAAKNERHAMAATFFFNIMHYALRPWPWILVALASLVLYPEISNIHEAFPQISEEKLGHDLAYSAMLTKLPNGLLGLVLTSLVAAYMSTISTQLNWGSSYIVFDFYKKQLNPQATEKQMVAVGRIATVGLLILSSILALALQNALQLFELLLVFGAGTGLVFILRWFWWRINAWTEIIAMFSSGIIALLLKLSPLGAYLFDDELGVLPNWTEYPMVVLVTTIIWLSATLLTPAESTSVLLDFYHKIRPASWGWKKVLSGAQVETSPENNGSNTTLVFGVIAMIVGSISIYSLMFATGNLIYGNNTKGFLLLFVFSLTAYALARLWKTLNQRDQI